MITRQPDVDWNQTVTTREFGSKTKAEALGRIVSPTAPGNSPFFSNTESSSLKKY